MYWPLRVKRNHLSTRSARSCSVLPSAMSANSVGCSHQYAINRQEVFTVCTRCEPGNSVRETGERMTGNNA